MENIDNNGIVLDGQSGHGLILLTLCFFQILHEFLSFLPLPSSIAHSADAFRVFRWRNLVVSWCHACITGVWTFACFILYWKEMWSDMIVFVNWPSYAVCCFATGYFIYDSLDIILARRILEKWEIMIHHSSIIFCAIICLSMVRCTGYHVLAMSIEMNTAFLHARKLLQLAKLPGTKGVMQINRYLNIVTFIPFRFGPLLMLSYASIIDGHRVPISFLYLFRTSLFVLIMVNGILFYRLVKADLFSKKRKAGQFAKHRKIDSSAEVCGSLCIQEDWNEQNYGGSNDWTPSLTTADDLAPQIID